MTNARMGGPAFRGRAALLALAVGTFLALGLCVSLAAQPARAYEVNVCTHEGYTVHRGPDGHWHGQDFVGHYNNGAPYYQHIHKVAHYRRYNGSYHWTWTRFFNCTRYRSADLPKTLDKGDAHEAELVTSSSTSPR